eukprot:403358172
MRSSNKRNSEHLEFDYRRSLKGQHDDTLIVQLRKSVSPNENLINEDIPLTNETVITKIQENSQDQISPKNIHKNSNPFNLPAIKRLSRQDGMLSQAQIKSTALSSNQQDEMRSSYNQIAFQKRILDRHKIISNLEQQDNRSRKLSLDHTIQFSNKNFILPNSYSVKNLPNIYSPGSNLDSQTYIKNQNSLNFSKKSILLTSGYQIMQNPQNSMQQRLSEVKKRTTDLRLVLEGIKKIKYDHSKQQDSLIEGEQKFFNHQNGPDQITQEKFKQIFRKINLVKNVPLIVPAPRQDQSLEIYSIQFDKIKDFLLKTSQIFVTVMETKTPSAQAMLMDDFIKEVNQYFNKSEKIQSYRHFFSMSGDVIENYETISSEQVMIYVSQICSLQNGVNTDKRFKAKHLIRQMELLVEKQQTEDENLQRSIVINKSNQSPKAIKVIQKISQELIMDKAQELIRDQRSSKLHGAGGDKSKFESMNTTVQKIRISPSKKQSSKMKLMSSNNLRGLGNKKPSNLGIVDPELKEWDRIIMKQNKLNKMALDEIIEKNNAIENQIHDGNHQILSEPLNHLIDDGGLSIVDAKLTFNSPLADLRNESSVFNQQIKQLNYELEYKLEVITEKQVQDSMREIEERTENEVREKLMKQQARDNEAKFEESLNKKRNLSKNRKLQDLVFILQEYLKERSRVKHSRFNKIADRSYQSGISKRKEQVQGFSRNLQVSSTPQMMQIVIKIQSQRSGFKRSEIIQIFSKFKALCEMTLKEFKDQGKDLTQCKGVNFEKFKMSLPELKFETETFAKRVFDQCNGGSHNEYLDWEHFLLAVRAIQARNIDQKIDLFFKIIDQDGNGSLSYDEVFEICSNSFSKFSPNIEEDQYMRALTEFFTSVIFRAVGKQFDEEIPLWDIKSAIDKNLPDSEILCLFCNADKNTEESYQVNLQPRGRRAESQEEILYKDDSQHKLYVLLKHEDKSDYKKLVLSASTLFNVVQLKRQIEKEFRNEFPRDPAYTIKNLCLTSGYVLPNSSKVGEVLKYGESLIAFPEKEKLFQHNCDQFCTCQFKTPATDLMNQLQDQQKSLASKLTEASIQRYDDKMELIKNTVSMGMTNDVRVIQNLALTLNKLIAGPLVIEFDKEQNKNILNLLVLVLQYWCTDLIDKDQLILINVMQTMECLSRSWTFTSAFKQQREAMEKLQKMAQDPQLAPSDRNQVFRVVSTISSTINISTLPEYNKAHFYNWEAVDGICKPDGNIISRSNLYKEPLHHRQLERGIKPSFAQTPNVAASRSKKFRDPQKQFDFEGLDQDFRQLYSSEQPSNYRTLKGSQSSAVLPTIQSNLRSSQLQHSGALQFNQINPPTPHYHDPCYFQEQQESQKYKHGGLIQKKENMQMDRTGSYLINPYKVTFLKDKYPQLEKFPPIQMVYSGDLLKDYCTMLNPEINQRDIIVFALHSIDNMGMQAIKDIMSDKYLLLLCFLLFEYHNYPSEISQSQFRVAQRLVENLSKQRAIDILENNGINRLLKTFKFQNSNMKKLITDLIYKILSYTKDYIDIPLLVNLTLFPNQEIKNAGIKTICEISDPADLEGNIKKHSQDRIDVTFHIHIPYLIQICQNKNSPQVFRNYALQTLANLTNREYLKSYITFNKGLELFVDYIKDTENMNGMRISTKALTIMAKGDSEMKVKLMSTLRKEIKDTWDGVQDPVFRSFSAQENLKQEPSIHEQNLKSQKTESIQNKQSTFMKKLSKPQPKIVLKVDFQLARIMQEKLINEVEDLHNKPEDYKIKLNVDSIFQALKLFPKGDDKQQLIDKILLNLERFQLNRFEKSHLLDYLTEVKFIQNFDSYSNVVESYKKYEYRSSIAEKYLEKCRDLLNVHEHNQTMSQEEIVKLYHKINEDMLEVINIQSLRSYQIQKKVLQQLQSYKNQNQLVDGIRFIHRYMELTQEDVQPSDRFDAQFQQSVLSLIDQAVTNLDQPQLKSIIEQLSKLGELNINKYDTACIKNIKSLVSPFSQHTKKNKSTSSNDQQFDLSNIIAQQYKTQTLNIDNMNDMLFSESFSDVDLGMLLDFSVSTQPLDTQSLRDQLDLGNSSLLNLQTYLLHTLINDKENFDQEVLDKVIEKSLELSKRNVNQIQRLQMLRFVLEIADQFELAESLTLLPILQELDNEDYLSYQITKNLYQNIGPHPKSQNIELALSKIISRVNKSSGHNKLGLIRSTNLYQHVKMFIYLERGGIFNYIDDQHTQYNYFYHLSDQYHRFTVIKNKQEYHQQIPSLVKFFYQIMNSVIPDHRLIFVTNDKNSKFFQLDENDRQIPLDLEKDLTK